MSPAFSRLRRPSSRRISSLPQRSPPACLPSKTLCARRQKFWKRHGAPDRILTSRRPTAICATATRRANGAFASSGWLKKAPEHVEGALALAQASIDVGDFAAARSALTSYATNPTRRVATVMASIAEAEGDVGRSREWLARAMRAAPDPAWTADGVISDSWLPVSPVSGRVDAFEWKLPLAEIGVERPTIEPDLVTPPRARSVSAAGSACRNRMPRRSLRRPRAAPAPKQNGRGSAKKSFRWCMRRMIPVPTHRAIPIRFRSRPHRPRRVGTRSASCFASAPHYLPSGRQRGFIRGAIQDSRRSSAVEHPLRKRGVGGSIPSAGTSFFRKSRGFSRLHRRNARFPP